MSVTAEQLARALHDVRKEQLEAHDAARVAAGVPMSEFGDLGPFKGKPWEDRPADSNRRAVEFAQAVLDRLNKGAT
jgi:hypothetical protein